MVSSDVTFLGLNIKKLKLNKIKTLNKCNIFKFLSITVKHFYLTFDMFI